MIDRATSLSKLEAFRRDLFEAERRGSASVRLREEARTLAALMPLDMFQEAMDLSNRAFALPVRKEVK